MTDIESGETDEDLTREVGFALTIDLNGHILERSDKIVADPDTIICKGNQLTAAGSLSTSVAFTSLWVLLPALC